MISVRRLPAPNRLKIAITEIGSVVEISAPKTHPAASGMLQYPGRQPADDKGGGDCSGKGVDADGNPVPLQVPRAQVNGRLEQERRQKHREQQGRLQMRVRQQTRRAQRQARDNQGQGIRKL